MNRWCDEDGIDGESVEDGVTMADDRWNKLGRERSGIMRVCMLMRSLPED